MNTDRFLAQINKSMEKYIYKYIIAAGLGVAAGLSACEATGVTDFIPNTAPANPNTNEIVVTPESDIYPTRFAWLDSRNEVVQKVMAEYGLSSRDIKGFEITVSGLLSAVDVREEKVQFINFIDPNTSLNVSAYYDSQNPNGLLNDFETVNRGGGLFIERQLVDLNNPNNYHTLLIISVDAEQKLKSGESTTIEFNPPEWVRAHMPALDPSKNLIVNVPIIPELTTTASLGFIPEFLVIDGSVEGIQTPIPTESQLPKKYTQQEIDRMTDEEKLTASPKEITQTVEDEIDGGSSKVLLTKSNVSSTKPELVVYRDGKGNIQSVYNLLTGGSQTVTEAGIIELDTVDDSKLEVLAFNDKQETLDFIAQKVLWFSGDRQNLNINNPLTSNMKKNIVSSRDSISGIIPKNGSGLVPPYPEVENHDIKEFFNLFIYDLNDKGVILIYVNSNSVPEVVFFNDLSSTNDRASLSLFIRDTWQFNSTK